MLHFMVCFDRDQPPMTNHRVPNFFRLTLRCLLDLNKIRYVTKDLPFLPTILRPQACIWYLRKPNFACGSSSPRCAQMVQKRYIIDIDAAGMELPEDTQHLPPRAEPQEHEIDKIPFWYHVCQRDERSHTMGSHDSLQLRVGGILSDHLPPDHIPISEEACECHGTIKFTTGPFKAYFNLPIGINFRDTSVEVTKDRFLRFNFGMMEMPRTVF